MPDLAIIRIIRFYPRIIEPARAAFAAARIDASGGAGQLRSRRPL